MEDKIKEKIKSKLSEKRYYHSICVAEQCEILAKNYNVDIKKARLIGLIHDIAKEMPNEEKLEYCLKNNISVDEIEKQKPGLLHGKIAADISKKEYGFTQDMCNAISYHTTGCDNMNILDKILFIADATGMDREWQDVEDVRQLAKKDLDQAVLYMLDMIINEKLENKDLIHINSILARNSILIAEK